MRRIVLLIGLVALLLHLCAFPVPAVGGEALKIDFNQTGGPVLDGFEGYSATNVVPSTFTAQSYSAFGTTVTIQPTWVTGAVSGTMRMVDRGGGTDTPDLLQDWIGTDNRQQPGDPMTLTISGLPSGLYTWLSYHHDTLDQTGMFDVTINDAIGTRTTLNLDATSGQSDGVSSIADVTTFSTEITSDGSDITFIFHCQLSTPTAMAFFLMNGFIIESQNPCYNAAPVIEGPENLTVFVHETLTMDVTVTDDGKPYIDGCDPEQPDLGESYGLQYYWSQTVGPAPVTFDPEIPNVEDPNITFTLPGTYELSLVAWDGPFGSGEEDGKISQHLITVEVIEPLKGDIDRNEIVDFRDVRLMAEQWLDEPACVSGNECADLDHSGIVNNDDFSLLLPNWRVNTTKIVINEFLASNRDTNLDGDGNASDWIELLNRDARSVSLNGWYLTDNKYDLRKWPFPSDAVIPSEGYLVIFASDQPTDDYVDAGGHIHANFSLEKGGEYLALIAPSGVIAHQYAPEFPPQEQDISYGMWYTTSRYFSIPTPGQANEGAFPGFTDKTSHSHHRGFYDAPFDLSIETDTPDAFIRYTLDGSDPTDQHGSLYDPNIPIHVAATSTIRSAAFKPGYMSAPITTHTYVFVDDVAQQPSDPEGWPDNWGYDSEVGGIVPADYEMDPRVVDNTLPGYSVRDALVDIPTVSIAMEPDDFIDSSTGIYANPRSRWERKCSMEYFLPGGGEDFQENCKIEMHGNSSRRPWRMQKHSMRITFTTLYGSAKLNYPLFPESPVERFNQLVLRACFTDSWGLVTWTDSRYRPNDSQYIRDVWMKESLRDMGQASSYGNFVHLYVNGLYFGVFNLSERLAEDFFADHLGGDPEHWEINADFSSAGSRWNAMMAINPSTLTGYSEMLKYLDVEDFADYMLLHFYADAEDWPSHNGYAAVNPVSGDGLFRFFVWDQEIVLDYHNRAAGRIDSTGGAGTLFQKMRTSEEFRLLFADRVHKHLFNSGALSQTVTQARYREVADWIDKAIVAESARWGDTQMSTPYGNTISQPSPLDDINHNLYPPAPHAPDYYFTREDSWLVERDNVIDNYIPAIHNTSNYYALLNLLRNENLYPATDAPVYQINGTARHSGYVPAGASLTMVNPNTGGVIYYTLDGTDPRIPANAPPASSNTLVAESASKTVLIPSADIGTGWRGGAEPYDDSGWISGTGGVGYETSSGYESYFDIDVLTPMRNVNQTCYVRIPFTVTSEELTGATYLNLNVRYDDGFAAYLNGTFVCSSTTAPATLAWDSGAQTSHADALAIVLETFDISAYLGLLHTGDNVLAIHGLNYTAGSTDFLISAELVVGSGGGAAGQLSPSAHLYSGALAINETTQVKARIINGAQWSALNEAVYATGPVAESLRVTELMYHPADPPTGTYTDDDFEFVELLNTGSVPINLNQVSFTRGIRFTFSSQTLDPDQYVIVARNTSALTEQYPGLASFIAGQYTGALDNDGERVELSDAAGTLIQSFRYRDGWYDITDGQGFSLAIRDPESTDPNTWSERDGWRPSAMVGGSPGFDDTGVVPEPGAVVINEVLAHSHDQAPDWIELHNTTGGAINIGGWYLSDSDLDDPNRMKYRIADGTTIPDGGYVVFYENLHFGFSSADPGVIIPFALSENGEEVVLYSGQDGALTGYRNREDFGASPTGIAFGRYQKSDGEFNFVAMSGNTPGTHNAYPLVGPIVISEIMYNPPSGDQDHEYVELLNITGSSVTLYDSSTAQPWKFTDGIERVFPTAPGLTIGPGERVLIVRNISAFTTAYGSVGVPILEYDAGSLDNGGEKLEISMPGDIDNFGVRQYIRIDRVNYSDGSHPEGTDPWPPAADGAGHSLHRKVSTAYGNDVANWQSAPASPGQ